MEAAQLCAKRLSKHKRPEESERNYAFLAKYDVIKSTVCQTISYKKKH